MHSPEGLEDSPSNWNKQVIGMYVFGILQEKLENLFEWTEEKWMANSGFSSTYVG